MVWGLGLYGLGLGVFGLGSRGVRVLGFGDFRVWALGWLGVGLRVGRNSA